MKRRSWRHLAGGAPVMVGQDQRRRDADEQRRDGIVVAVIIDGDNRGRRFAIDEAGEQREVPAVARRSGST